MDVILHDLEKFAEVEVYGTIELEVSLVPETRSECQNLQSMTTLES
jgi:hypothetical protein